MDIIENLLDIARKSIQEKSLSKITLSKPKDTQSDLANVYIRIIKLKERSVLSFTYKYKTKDETKNLDIDEGLKVLSNLVTNKFKNASLITTDYSYQLLTSKKGKVTLNRSKNTASTQASVSHDRQKNKPVTGSEDYLKFLGVAHPDGTIIPKMADKFRQINKYIEIVANLVENTELPDQINVVDMGSGKGYLTFALYDFLQNKLNKNVQMTGVELRDDMVVLCNDIAQKCGFDNLKFYKSNIQDFKSDKIDILIALHACDTATDDALLSGMMANASLIISAPCCHKQIRQQVKGKEQNSPILKYGIFKERQFEMITDTIRALILEKNQYQSKIFEFVSNEHTRKNILLVATKSTKSTNVEYLDEKINSIKSEYGIESHYLEEIIK